MNQRLRYRPLSRIQSFLCTNKHRGQVVDFKIKYIEISRMKATSRVSRMLVFMQIAGDTVRKIIWSVSFSSDPSHDTENTLLAFCQNKGMRRGVVVALPFSFSFSFVFFVLRFENFLIFFTYPSREILQMLFDHSFDSFFFATVLQLET